MGQEMTGTIVIAEYDPRWPKMYGIEEQRIRQALGELLVDIEHIGSTSVPGLAAKPRIDIMPGLASEDELDRAIGPMTAIGFRYIPDYEDVMPYRRLFTRHAEDGRCRVTSTPLLQAASSGSVICSFAITCGYIPTSPTSMPS
jgi:GrpB-like predicted nucleotidyltransferase (UPF0157 family)